MPPAAGHIHEEVTLGNLVRPWRLGHHPAAGHGDGRNALKGDGAGQQDVGDLEVGSTVGSSAVALVEEPKGHDGEQDEHGPEYRARVTFVVGIETIERGLIGTHSTESYRGMRRPKAKLFDYLSNIWTTGTRTAYIFDYVQLLGRKT